MQSITFYAYKGGTGRTLALANAAVYLARLKQSVFAIDLDLESPGLHHKLALSPGGAVLRVERGIVDCIHTFAEEQRFPDQLLPYTIAVPREDKRDGPITLMPAGNVLSAGYWKQLAQLNWHEFFYGEVASGIPFFLELKERIKREFSPDFLLIDARTGITEVGGVATTLLPDQVICLLLNNRENLEGAREVLRGIKRASSQRKKAIGIVPVLARIPDTFRHTDSEREQKLLEDVRAFLCEPPKDASGALDLASMFVLHTEDSLAYDEALRIGGKRTVDESPLLRDYLHLFAQVIPSEQVEPHLDRLIDAAATKEKLLENPERVQSDLEALSIYCPHQASYLALLKFYRLRNAPSTTILRTAVRFWEASHRVSHPILDAVVRDHYRVERRSLEEMHSSVDQFALAVWESSKERDPEVGLRIADNALRSRRKRTALDVIAKILASAHGKPETIVACINRLVNAGEYNQANTLVEQWSAILAEHSEFQVAWASLVVATRDPSAARKLLESQAFRPASILAKAPLTYVRLLRLADRKEELDAALQNALDRSIASQEFPELHSTGMLFAELGKFDTFQRRIEESLPKDLARQLIRNITRHGLPERVWAISAETRS